jgi:hypothetical protein
MKRTIAFGYSFNYKILTTALFSLLLSLATFTFSQPMYYNFNTTGTNNAFPLNVNPSTGKTIQSLYLPGAFNQPISAPAGLITKFWMQTTAASGGNATYTRLTIKMGQTTDVDLPTGAWYTGTMTTVLDSANYNLVGVPSQFFSITLSTPFSYNPAQSLVVEITQCGYSGSGIGICYSLLISGTKRSAGPLSPVSCPHPWGNQNNYTTNAGIDIDTLVGIGNNNSGIPDTYILEQNYPNPFNPMTSISFSLPSSGITNLAVYDIMGREVIVLVNEMKTAGNYSVTFDAANLSSGIYFYTLKSGGFVESKKMLLIK